MPIHEVFKILELNLFFDAVGAQDLEVPQGIDDRVAIKAKVIEHHGVANAGVALTDFCQYLLMNGPLTGHIIKFKGTGQKQQAARFDEPGQLVDHRLLSRDKPMQAGGADRRVIPRRLK